MRLWLLQLCFILTAGLAAGQELKRRPDPASPGRASC
ncbi:hypothetical protein BH24BAC1_BH24BAC1_34070 [soil metagenome]